MFAAILLASPGRNRFTQSRMTSLVHTLPSWGVIMWFGKEINRWWRNTATYITYTGHWTFINIHIEYWTKKWFSSVHLIISCFCLFSVFVRKREKSHSFQWGKISVCEHLLLFPAFCAGVEHTFTFTNPFSDKTDRLHLQGFHFLSFVLNSNSWSAVLTRTYNISRWKED